LLGLLMDSWDRACEELGRSDDHLARTVLIAVGASRWLGLSRLTSTLALGATVANASYSVTACCTRTDERTRRSTRRSSSSAALSWSRLQSSA
jgi:hypothetical protein